MTYVTKQLAIKLKQAGFDVPVFGRYYQLIDDNKIYYSLSAKNHSYSPVNVANDNTVKDVFVSAPTLYEVTDWLRERHGLHVVAEFIITHEEWAYCIQNLKTGQFNTQNQNLTGWSYAEALAAGIEHAVDEVLKRMNNGLEQQ